VVFGLHSAGVSEVGSGAMAAGVVLRNQLQQPQMKAARTSATSSATPPGTSSRQHLREHTSLRREEESRVRGRQLGSRISMAAHRQVSARSTRCHLHKKISISPGHATAALAGCCASVEGLPPPLLPPRHPAGPCGIRLRGDGAWGGTVRLHAPPRRTDPSSGACRRLWLGRGQAQGPQGSQYPQHLPFG